MPQDHAFRRARAAFNSHPELHPAPIRQSGEEIRIMAKEREVFLARGDIEDAEDDPMKEHGVKRLTTLDVLPYWQIDYFILQYRENLFGVYCARLLIVNYPTSTNEERMLITIVTLSS